MDKIAIIVRPSQGSDLRGFGEVARILKATVYRRGETRIVRTVLTQATDGTALAFLDEDNLPFSFTQLANADALLTISHAGRLDGPTMASGSLDLAVARQPWPSTNYCRTSLDPSGPEICGWGLEQRAMMFWAQAGQRLKPSGKIIIVGCNAGAGFYAQLVANGSRRTTFASTGRFGAGDRRFAVPQIEHLERTGQPLPPMRAFHPAGPACSARGC